MARSSSRTICRACPLQQTTTMSSSSLRPSWAQPRTHCAFRYSSGRREGPLVKVGCGAIPENLVDSELSGHEEGAFAGAFARKRGRFERADQGTLFLDEIGDLSPSAQVRLLWVLQRGEIERVGGTRPIGVDTWVTERLTAYDWPGNVRELENAIERTLIRSQVGARGEPLHFEEFCATGSTTGSHVPTPDEPLVPLDEAIRRHIRAGLDLAGGKVQGAEGAAYVPVARPWVAAAFAGTNGLGRLTDRADCSLVL